MLLQLALLLLLEPPKDLFRQDNLVAWCVVPFDSKDRSPAERVAMLKKLGIKRFAYDWRDKHLPTFETEVKLLIKEGIQLQSVWFPATLNKDAETILDILKRNKMVTELWVSLDDPKGADDATKVKQAVAILKPLVEAAETAGCSICLYNHGGWMGDPKNLRAIELSLDSNKVGLIFNLHHGHAYINNFSAVMTLLKPYLKCVTLNGMVPKGDQVGKKILPIGAGTEDLKLLKIIQESGYTGPIAILGHVHEVDVEERLRDNLDGLNWLKAQLTGRPAGPKPINRTYRP
ncbi:MAG: TIM barrel protein [Gemmatales bacterium]